MLKDINSGRVDCIVVKDLSRFGRDYIEVGRFIQKIFPALNVRFIAITDQFDSLTADYNETSLVLPIRNFVNDSYCRDISGKVRSHQRIKRENGEFIGAFAAYGYCKDKNNKNKLVPDKYAAQIVRNIFAWRMDGMSPFAIAERLNEIGVLSPMEYKKSKGENYNTGFAVHVRAAWSSVAVKRILTNEIYIGTMVQGKSEKINYKLTECRKKPKSEWVRVENTHEAIIKKEDFYNTQRLLSVGSRAFKGQKKAHLFSGLLFCGNCMKPMIRRVNRYKGMEKIYFICPTSNKGEGCTRHCILEEALKEVIWNGLKMQLNLLFHKSKVLSGIEGMRVNLEEVAPLEQELLRLRQEEEKYLALRRGLYEDLKDGILTQEDFYAFRNIYDEQYVKAQEAIEKQEEMIHSVYQSGIASGIRLEQIKEMLELTELNRDVLLVFINKIMVYEDKRIGIELNSQPSGMF